MIRMVKEKTLELFFFRMEAFFRGSSKIAMLIEKEFTILQMVIKKKELSEIISKIDGIEGMLETVAVLKVNTEMGKKMEW